MGEESLWFPIQPDEPLLNPEHSTHNSIQSREVKQQVLSKSSTLSEVSLSTNSHSG